MSKYARIRPKSGGAIIPFVMNEAQWIAHNALEKQKKEIGMVRACIVKGRQQGMSTYVNGRYLHRATLNCGTSVFILSHMSDSTDYLFKMVKRMFNNLPDPLKPFVQASNRKELVFGKIDSDYALGTAGSEDIGRGRTPLLLHVSEAAFLKNTDELTTGLFQGVPECEGSEIILESTANGVNNLFHSLCMTGAKENSISEYITIFVPWFKQPEYQAQPPDWWKPDAEDEELMQLYGLTKEQVFWRKRKLETTFKGDIWKFKQEYPCYMAEAFVSSDKSLISPELIIGARKRNLPIDTFAPRLMGVDSAGSGDRTAICIRQGKKIEQIIYYRKMNDMRLAGIVAAMIDKENIDMAFYDLGYGTGTFYRLHELGYKKKVCGVHFGSTAINSDLYQNKRAEMYGLLKEWFEEDGGADIPDNEEFHADLCMVPQLQITTSRSKLGLPSKDKIREDNGGMSPDGSDAAALTFAFPVKGKYATMNKKIQVKEFNVNSPFKSRRLAQGGTQKRQVSELYIG